MTMISETEPNSIEREAVSDSSREPRRPLLGTRRRTVLAALATVAAVFTWLSIELMALQAGLTMPPQSAIAAAAANSNALTPAAPIGSYDSFRVDVAGGISVDVHYRESAAATENVVLVHGAGGGAWVWEEFFDLMPDDLNLYAISWRGHFTSSPVDDADAGDYVEDQLAAIEAIQARNTLPIHAVGHSYGGATTVLATASDTSAIESVHLLAPVVPLDFTPAQAVLAPLIAPIFINQTASSVAEAVEEGAGPTGNYTEMFVDVAQRDRYWDLYAGKPFSIEKEGLIAGSGVSPDWQDALDVAYTRIGESGVPVWFVVSVFDNVVSIDEQRETAEQIGAPVTELESGHYIPLDTEVATTVDLIGRNILE